MQNNHVQKNVREKSTIVFYIFSKHFNILINRRQMDSRIYFCIHTSTSPWAPLYAHRMSEKIIF